MLKSLARVAKERGTTFYALGVFAVLFGALLFGRALWTLGRKREYEREIARHREVLEAAMRMLWSQGVQFRSAQRYPTSEGDLTAADSDLVESTVRRMGGQRPSEPQWNAYSTPAPHQGKPLLRYGS